MSKLRVALLFGGRSAEHDVSLMSATSVARAMDRARYEVLLVGITKEGHWIADLEGKAQNPRDVFRLGNEVILSPDPEIRGFIPLISLPIEAGSIIPIPVDIVFPVLHGPFGEDGTIQGLFELAGLPYVGAGVLGSSVAMDKDVMKRLFRDAGLPMVPWITLLRSQWEKEPSVITERLEAELNYPLFIKPANLGSSVGISKVKSRFELSAAMTKACRFDRKVVVEQGVTAQEIECSVLGNDEPAASVPGEIIPSREFYSYEAKYIDETSQLIIPAPIPPQTTQRIQKLAVQAFLAVEASGMARVDFFLDKNTGEVVVNEINTIPGFTKISMFPRLWEASGIPYPELIDRLIELAMERFHDRQRSFTHLQGDEKA